MAMNDNNGILTMIDNLVDDVQADQTTAQKKANTVAAAVGAVLTMLISGGSYLVASETTLPSWFPLLMTGLGLLATVLKINKTKNGVTSSVAVKLQDALSDKIDLNHVHGPENQTYQEPTPREVKPIEKALDLRAVAEGILNDVVGRH